MSFLRTLFGPTSTLTAVVLAMLVSGVNPPTVLAQVTSWQRADGGFGEGNVTHLAINPSGHLFAGTNTGIYRSTDDGTSWKHTVDGIVFALAAHPNGDLYASIASDTAGLLRSTDNGNTWLSADLGVSNPLVLALAIRVSGTIFAATNHTLYRSTNNGAAWTSSTVTSGDSIVTALGLASGLLFAGLSDPSIPFGFGTVRRSTDDGATWSQFSPVWSLDPVNAVVRNSAGYTFAATQSGIRRSTDFGASWTLTSGLGAGVNAIAINGAGFLFAAVGDRFTQTILSGGIFRSTNRGDSWVKVNDGLTIPNGYSVAVSPSGHIYAGTPFTGVFQSVDTAATWTLINRSLYSSVHAVVQLQNGVLLAGTDDGVFRTTNSGGAWFQNTTGLPGSAVNVLHQSANGSVYAGFNNPGAGVARSTDGGLSWTSSATGLGSRRAFAIASGSGGLVVAGTDQGLFRSTDDGGGWSVSGAGGPSTTVRALVRDAVSGRIFAGSQSGVFLSTDNGDTWTSRSSGLGGAAVLSLTRQDAGHLYAGTDAGVFQSTDEGGNWITASGGIPAVAAVSALAFGSDGFLYAATQDSGVYRSSNGGGSWDAASSGISNLSTSSLALGSSGYLYAGAVRVFGTGITLFRASQPTTSVAYTQAGVATEFGLDQNYPNPFNPVTLIRYTIAGSGEDGGGSRETRLVVYDILGRVVSVLVNEKKMPGRYEVEFNANGLASGVYMYRLTAGSSVQSRRMLLLK
jgi:photosystem II stability/assembly factor-like uncharacterized protein